VRDAFHRTSVGTHPAARRQNHGGPAPAGRERHDVQRS